MNNNNFRIDSVDIVNYKKYNSLNLKLNQNFMLIIGANGSGKTTILDAIATLLGVYLQAFKNISSSEIHSIKKQDIKINIIDQQNNIVTKYNEPTSISGICNMYDSEIPLKRVKKNIKSKNRLLKKEHKKLIDVVETINTNDELILPIISYHGTGRLWEQQSKNSSNMEQLTRLDGYKDCLNAKSNYRNFVSWFKKQELNAFNLRAEIPILEAVRNTVIQMLSMLTGKEIQLFIYREDGLEIKYKDEEKRERVSNLSDGYRNMIGMISDIAYRMAILNPSLGLDVTQKTSGVVLIDELDLHLHPKWQKEITSILIKLFPKVQFIVTSHSPFIIQSQKSKSIIKLDESNEPLLVNATELSIEDISEDIQDIPTPQMSSKKILMLETAKKYFEKLETLEKGGVSEDEVRKIKNDLDKVSALYDDNMAYVAFLERKRLITESRL